MSLAYGRLIKKPTSDGRKRCRTEILLRKLYDNESAVALSPKTYISRFVSLISAQAGRLFGYSRALSKKLASSSGGICWPNNRDWSINLVRSAAPGRNRSASPRNAPAGPENGERLARDGSRARPPWASVSVYREEDQMGTRVVCLSGESRHVLHSPSSMQKLQQVNQITKKASCETK